VGLKTRILSALVLFTFVTLLDAAPMLRLVTSVVGPIPVPTGGSAPAQIVEGYNAGDGSLPLTVSVPSSVTWLTASVGASRACASTTAASTCVPLQFALNTSGLAAGTYTGTVTVNAGSSTIDAPQTITVTVRVGPVDVYVAPGKSNDLHITTNHAISATASTQDGNRWLSLTLEGTGSFRFVYPYRIHVQPADGMTEGTYTGSVTTSGSSVASENVTIPVTMHLTSQPIAQAVPDQINLRLAQGAPPLVYPFDPIVTLTNLGLGTLIPGSMTLSGGSWIKSDTLVPAFISIDPTGLANGDNTGLVTIASNAINAPTKVPVDLQIVDKGAPLIFYQQVLDNVTSIVGDAVSQGDVAIVKGEQLSFSPFTQTPGYPLPTLLGGTSILVNGALAPLYYTSYGQIAFQMPYDAPPGTALVQVKRDDGQISNTATVEIAVHAPRLLATVYNQDGSVNSTDGSHPANRGETIVIHGFGFGPTSPPVTAGAPAPLPPSLAQVTGELLVSFGDSLFGANVMPAFAGLTPQISGVYQVNVVIPDGSPTGLVNVSVSFAEAKSNAIAIVIQ
jgi:adhesin/invasin